MIEGISTTYPYNRVYDYVRFGSAEDIPYKVLTYLMDFPSQSYTPPDDNDYPRTRLKKYLYWDEPNPLDNVLPTMAQLKMLWYNPAFPDTCQDEERGYRIFPQSLISQAQIKGQTIIRCSIGNVTARTSSSLNSFGASITVTFDVLSSTAIESNTRTTVLSRTFAMACCIVDALNGVNIDGVGSFYFDRNRNSYCGMTPINDETSNIGYRVVVGLDWMGDNSI